MGPDGFLTLLYDQAIRTVLDLAPIVVVVSVFQFGIIRRSFANLPRILVGLVYVTLGLILFRIGLEESLIPVGRDMARQLVAALVAMEELSWWSYLPLLSFAAAIGFTAALIEPTLVAAAGRVQELSGGSLRARVLRMVVSCGVALGLFLGTLRIVGAFPLAYMLAGSAILLVLLALFAPRSIVPLAFDSGGIATSVVTVPLIAAYGVTLAEAMPTETTAADGFGLIVLALLYPVILLLAFTIALARFAKRPTMGGTDAV